MGSINGKKKYGVLFLLIFTLLAVLGCAASKTDNQANKIPLKKVDIAAGNTSVANILAVVGKYAGYYEEEGLDVNINIANNNADSLGALTSGKVLVAGGGATAPLNLIDDGVDLVVIGGAMGQGAGLFTLPERSGEWKNITQESIKGKKIGVTRAQSGDIAFRTALKEKGIDLTKVEFVELGDCPTIIQGVLKGTLDAGIVFMTFRVTAEQQGLVPALHIDELAPGFICCRVTTTKKVVNDNREELVKLLKGQIKAYRLYRTDPQKTIALAKQFVKVDEKIIESQLYNYGHLTLSPNPAKNKVYSFYKGMALIGYSKGQADLDKHVDTSLFEDALNELLAKEPNDKVFLELKKEFDETQKISA